MAERVNQAGVWLAQHLAIAALQVAAELAVVIQPPQRRRREEQILGALLAQRRELGNRRGAVRWVVAAILSCLILRKVVGRASFELEQLIAAFADDNHLRLMRQRTAN